MNSVGKARTHNAAPEAEQRKSVEKQIARAEFGRRLNAALVERGWSQAEFSRRCEDKAPEGMRIGPDSLSHYINGRYFPTPAHVQVMANTLGIEVEKLMPLRSAKEVGDDKMPPIDVKDMSNGMAWLRINQAVVWTDAVKILAILRGEETK